MTAVVIALVAGFDWNWVKSPLQNYLSGKFGRAFVINGDLKGEFSMTPRLTGSDVTLANAPWGSEPLLGRAKEVAVRVDLRSLFGGNVSLLELILADAALLFERDAEGRQNWNFGDGSKKVDIGRLGVDSGTVRYFDRERGIDVRSRIESAKAGDDGQLTFRFDGSGVWETGELTMKGVATTPFAADVADRPYRLNVEATSGGTTGTFEGDVVLSRGIKADGSLAIKGRDLSELGGFVPIEFSRTPPYRITGRLKHENSAWSLENLSAKIGETDLSGRFDVDRSGKRTQVVADLTSQSANYKDMRALAGMPADDLRHARVEADGNTKKPADDKSVVSDRAKGSPDLARIKLVDAQIRLKAKRFIVPQFRLDDLNAAVDVRNGVMKIQPLDFVLAGGQVTSTISVDARDKIAKATTDVKARDVDLNVLVPKLKTGGNAGKASGRGHFTATGNSVAELLASSDGEAALISAGGNAGSISAGLGQIDLARAGRMLLRGDAGTPIQCAVADVTLKNGVVDIRKFVVDTESDAIVGDGKILLAEKRYDLEFTLQPKRPSLSALGGPVRVDGTFAHPNVHREGGPLLARVGAALGLVAVSPIVALLPLVDMGGETGTSCKTLVQNTRAKLKDLKSIDPAANGSTADATGPRARR